MTDQLKIAFILVAGVLLSATPYLPANPTTQAMLAAVACKKAAGGYTYYSASFSASPDGDMSISTEFSPAATDGPDGLISFWIKMASGSSDATAYDIWRNSGGYFTVQRSTADAIWIRGYTAGASLILNIVSDTDTVEKADGWVHVLAAWQLDATPTTQLYIDGIDVNNETAATTGSIDYTRGGFNVASGGGAAELEGLLCEVYINMGEYLDISNSANRDKFSSGGKPISLGADGSTPTGTAPTVYLNQEVPNFESNQGCADGFTENGTIGDGGADKP